LKHRPATEHPFFGLATEDFAVIARVFGMGLAAIMLGRTTIRSHFVSKSCLRLGGSQCAHQDGGQEGRSALWIRALIRGFNYANYPTLAALFQRTGRARWFKSQHELWVRPLTAGRLEYGLMTLGFDLLRKRRNALNPPNFCGC